MAVGVHRFYPRKRKVILKGAWGYFREDWSSWGGWRVRATSLGVGCLSDFIQPHLLCTPTPKVIQYH